MFRTRNGLMPRINVTMPPRHGKTSVTSQRFLPWVLLNNPDWEVAVTSYSQTIAEKASLAARNLLESNPYVKKVWPHITISKERSSVKEWFIYNKGKLAGCYRAVGVGGSFTGNGYNLLVCDDLFKNSEEADSPLIRGKVWDWYTSVALTRQAPLNGIVNINTRWHLDDHIGRLLKLEPDRWLNLKYPAINADGLPLMPERFTLNQLLKIKHTMPPRLWAALYEQNPINVEGNIVKEHFIKSFVTPPDDFDMMVQSWDLRFSRSQSASSSFVVGQVWGKHDGKFYLVDQIRERLSYTESRQAIVAMSNKYPKATIRLVEKKANGDAIDDDLEWLGITLVEPKGDKVQRLERCYGLLVSGQVFIAEELLPIIKPELLSFPNGDHDDQCFIAGTKIKTLFGDKNIEDIKKGDYVLTPFGYSKVKQSCCSGIKKVINRHGVTGTSNHPVFCKNSFMFKDLIDDYKPLYLNFRSFLWLRLLLNLSGTAIYISLSGVKGITSEVRQLMQQEKVYQCYTETFMSFIVAKKYLKAVSFIIKTAITLIMTLAIWSVYLLPSIKSYTENTLGILIGLLSVKKTLITLGKRLRFGINQSKVNSGTESMLNIQYKKVIQHRLQKFVYCAAMSTPQKNLQINNLNFAHAIAEKNLGIVTISIKKLLTVLFAKNQKNCQHTQKLLLAEVTVVEEMQPVYNLTVDAGVYFANGLLVHNCDALSQCLNWFQDNDYSKLEISSY